jgi:putative endonuclease
MEPTYHVYILASGRNGTLYTGVTGDLAQRCWQHRNGQGGDFTGRYGVHRLVHAEAFADVNAAIAREKAIKKWRRAWKLELIERDNPQWLDLYDRING